jgi:large subunit ribosomal protein L23
MAIAKKSKTEAGAVTEKKVAPKAAQTVKKGLGLSSPKGALLNPANEFIIKYPLITEKAYHMSAKGQYVFVVDKHTNKVEVRKAIKKIYNVDPVSVNTVTIRGERQKFRGVAGKKVTLKKAIVTLKKGQKLDIMPS